MGVSFVCGLLRLYDSCYYRLSFQRHYSDGGGHIFPQMTAIVNVKGGTVTGVTWDDASVFCGKSRVKNNMYDYSGRPVNEKEAEQPVGSCWYDMDDECDEWTKEGRTDCDMILYVVWAGTDKNGNSFLSSGYRFSEFPIQDLGDKFSQNLPPVVSDIAEST